MLFNNNFSLSILKLKKFHSGQSTESIDSELAEFLPEEESIETQAALAVPLLSQDPPEIEEQVAVIQNNRRLRRRDKNKNLSPDVSMSLTLNATAGKSIHMSKSYSR